MFRGFSPIKVMRDSGCVIAQVVNGHGPKLAEILEVSVSRCYEILSTDNPYPKAKRLIRAIAQVNTEGCRLIKADLDAMFYDILGSDRKACRDELRRESFEAVNAVYDNKPIAEQKQELREQIAAASKLLEELENPREFAKRAANGRVKQC